MDITEPGFAFVPNTVVFEIVRGGEIVETIISQNSRVDVGATATANYIGTTGGAAGPFNFVALSSTNGLTPAHGDTTLSGEYVSFGLARKAATYGSFVAASALNGLAQFVFTATWTNTDTSAHIVYGVGCFNQISAGTLYAETALGSPVTLNASDVANLTWTFNV